MLRTPHGVVSRTEDQVSGKTVKTEIQKKGLKIVWVAQQLGLSHSHLSRQLSGERPITSQQAERMSTLLDLPVDLFKDGAA